VDNGTVDGIAGWSPEIERSFKQQLFRFLEEIQSTKAALYLLAEDGRYVAVARYGFGRRDRLAEVHGARDPMSRRARELRTLPWAANQPEEADELAEYIEGAGTARLLLVPLYADSRVIGFVDARDKGRKRPFDRDDLRVAAGIGSAIITLVRSSGLYPDLQPPEDGERDRAPADAAGGSSFELPVDSAAITELRRAAERLGRLGGVSAIGVSTVTPQRATILMCADADDRSVEHAPVLRHQEQALRSVATEAPPLETWRLERVPAGGSRGAGDRVIASAVLDSGRAWAVVASAVALRGDRTGEAVLQQLREVWESARRGARERAWHRAALRRLLTPGEHPYAELVAHSESVSRLAWSMARHLGLDDVAVEEAALVGLLHDVGMRELEYDRLYRHPSPGSDELRILRRHPEDGAGYPGRLSGDGIPELSRIVHLAETWDVLTSPTSYRATASRPDAEAVLRQEAGHQFDPRLVSTLLDVVG
jgi:hypothetical protein